MANASFSSSRSGGDATIASSSSKQSYSMFPIVEKTYRVRVTEDIERDLRFLGQSRVDALTSNFDMTLVKDKGNLQLYELAEQEFFTMKGVTTVNAPLEEVMALLRMDSTAKLRQVMGDIFGTLFLDGVVLHRAKETRKNESLSVNWTALQSSKPHLPHRDYVFLRYGDVFEKPSEHGNSYHSNGSGLYVGASIWESIELDGCDPLPSSQNVVRLRMRRCGIVVEETNSEAGLRISFFLSEAHPGRAAVSTLTRGWMTKLVSCTSEIANVIIARALASQALLSKNQFIKDGVNCFICVKTFSMFRRKHHCRVCGDVVCSKCSEVKNLKQSGVTKEIRVCQQCRNSSTASIRSSGSDSRTLRSGASKPSFSNYSMASSDASQSYDEDTSTYNGSTSSNTNTIPENSLSDSNSESARVKTYQTPAPRLNGRNGGGIGPEQPKLLSKKPSMTSSDMILLSKQEAQLSTDMILLNNKRIEASGYSEFGMYTNDGPDGLSPEEMAEMELQSTVRENTPFKYALSYTSRQEWPKAPLPMNEVARLKKVRELHLADPGLHFQEMCEYAAAEMGCQIAGVCFIGDKTGFLMAKVGLEKRELSRNVLFDAHTIMSDDPTIILDATEDIRFVNNPLVQEGQVRFYAGFPMITSDGHTVGSFCVADPFARESLSGDKFFFLKNLADVAIRGVEQNTINQMAGVESGNSSTELGSFQVPPPPAMNIVEAHQTMQELLKTAYSTQVQVRMQVNPLTK
ncbi:Lateral signaling target protein 2 [Globisporangium polare]